MPDDQAKIIVGASPVAANHRHTYLIFETSDGRQTVVRGGPDAHAEGSQVGNLLDSTVFGSNDFGKIRVDSAPYVPPLDMAYKAEPDGNFVAVPIYQIDPNDKSIQRDAKGHLITDRHYAPDWPLPGETHERIIAWRGSDTELNKKLETALQVGQQINEAKLEYSPLYNNSNGVTSNVLKAIEVQQKLPVDKDENAVNAPDFGQPLYQNVGIVSHLSGYSLDGNRWKDQNGDRINPPKDGEPIVPIDLSEKESERSFFDSRSSSIENGKVHPKDPPLINVPEHPDYPLFQQAQRGIYAVDEKLGRTPDLQSEQLAALLTVVAKQRGLTSIDHVRLSEDGSRAFAAQGELGQVSKIASVDTHQAVNTSVAQSSVQWRDVIELQNATRFTLAQNQNDLSVQSAQQATGPLL